MFWTNLSIRTMMMQNCNIGARGAIALGEGLVKNHTLKHLNLANNKIEDDGGLIFANVLSSPKTNLKYLNISVNHVSNRTCIAIAKTLHRNRTLAYLILRDNSIKNEGVQALIDNV